jgi:hypothetical protein
MQCEFVSRSPKGVLFFHCVEQFDCQKSLLVVSISVGIYVHHFVRISVKVFNKFLY